MCNLFFFASQQTGVLPLFKIHVVCFCVAAIRTNLTSNTAAYSSRSTRSTKSCASELQIENVWQIYHSIHFIIIPGHGNIFRTYFDFMPQETRSLWNGSCGCLSLNFTSQLYMYETETTVSTCLRRCTFSRLIKWPPSLLKSTWHSFCFCMLRHTMTIPMKGHEGAH